MVPSACPPRNDAAHAGVNQDSPALDRRLCAAVTAVALARQTTAACVRTASPATIAPSPSVPPAVRGLRKRRRTMWRTCRSLSAPTPYACDFPALTHRCSPPNITLSTDQGLCNDAGACGCLSGFEGTACDRSANSLASGWMPISVLWTDVAVSCAGVSVVSDWGRQDVQ